MCNNLTSALNVEDCSYSNLEFETCQINEVQNWRILCFINYKFFQSKLKYKFLSNWRKCNNKLLYFLGGDVGDDNTINVCDSDATFNIKSITW